MGNSRTTYTGAATELPSSSVPAGPARRVTTTARWALRAAELLDDCHARYGNAFTLNLLKFGRASFFASPTAAEYLFRTSPATYRAGKTKFIRPILGPSSLLCLDGPDHLRQRRLLLPSLHGARISTYSEIAHEMTLAEMQSWRVGHEFALMAGMQRITLAVVLRAVFGLHDVDERERVGDKLLALMHAGTGSPAQLIRMGIRRDLAAAPPASSRLGRLLANADATLYGIIATRRRSDSGGDDVLSMLLAARDEDGRPMTDDELRDELLTLLLTGHETTAASLAWTFERLLRSPAAWERLRDESRAGTAQVYATAVVTEALRTRPVLWLAGRTLIGEHTIDGHTLPSGSLAYVCSYLLHRREDLYPDARAFRPERFIEGGRDPYTFVPFGGGLRRCIGAAFAERQMATVIQAVAASCDLVAVDPNRDERFVRRGIVVAPDRGARVVARP